MGRLCELNRAVEAPPVTPQAGFTAAADGTPTVIEQFANGLPFWLGAKPMVILTSTGGVLKLPWAVGSVTVTELLTEHLVAPLQSRNSGVPPSTMADGSAAPTRACTSLCRLVNTGLTVAAVSGLTSKE